jgi:glycosyltransferase involved in cell wall biosynthesis
VDCVHVHAERASIVTSVLPRLLGVPVVRTVHSSFEFSGSLRVRKMVERWISRSIGLSFVAVSPSVHSNEGERFRNESHLILNWFDDRRFAPPTTSDRETAREHFEVGDRIVLAVVGNCSMVKNHALLFHALALCPAMNRPLVLHAGAPEHPDQEAELVERLRIHEDVRFLGPTSDVLPVLHAADAFVMPSLYEGLPIAAIEGAATGLPLFLADVAGLRDLASLLSSVLLVPLDSRPLAAELQKIPALDAADEARVEMSAETREAFDRNRGVRAYVALYRGSGDYERTI